jgi:hypothetical protein
MTLACTLNPHALATRRRLIDALADDALIDRTPTPDGLRVRLRDTPGIERRARALIALESECCGFLDFELGREDGALVLAVTGPVDSWFFGG